MATTTTNTSSGDSSPAMTAAEHSTLAASYFARAQAIYDAPEHLGAVNRLEECVRQMRCAQIHLRLAEVITQGAALIATHRQALADPNLKIQRTSLGNEANAWNDLISGQPVADRRNRSA